MIRLHRWMIGAVALAASLGLSGCMGMGGLGGYPGSSSPGGQSYPYPGQGYPQGGYGQSITGSVDGVDHGNARFILREDSGYGNRVEINYDRNTVLHYNGQQLSPSGLENGDRIRVQAAQSNGRWWAQNIEVLQDVRGGYGGTQPYATAITGSVTYVDMRNRLIHYTQGGYSGGNQRVRYDDNTFVEYRGMRYRADQLERGDVIRIEGRMTNGNEFLAQRIVVETSVRQR